MQHRRPLIYPAPTDECPVAGLREAALLVQQSQQAERLCQEHVEHRSVVGEVDRVHHHPFRLVFLKERPETSEGAVMSLKSILSVQKQGALSVTFLQLDSIGMMTIGILVEYVW